MEAHSGTLYHEAEWGTWEGEPRIMEPEKCSEIGWFWLSRLPEPLFPGLERAALELIIS